MNTTSDIDPPSKPLISLHKFCRDAGISDVTAWRWRRRGWLATVNIAGRQYITNSGLADFMRKAEAGEFAVKPKTPKRR